MAVKLSIIVPIYNVAPYLRKCVDSLLAQDLPSSEYEIILVDDESPDACPQICDDYAAAHSTIRVVHRENGGLSAARNSGIEVARGEYIMFVDSDDYIEPNVLGGLMEQVEKEQLDVLRYDYQNVRIVDSRESIVNSRYEVFEPNKQPHKADKRYEIVDGVAYLNMRMRYACYAWQWIVRKEIVSMFTKGIHFEDVDWLPRMMLKAKRVNSTQMVVYDYFWREGSITQTQGNKDKIRRNIEDLLSVIEAYNSYQNQYPNCPWLRNMQSSLVAGVLTTIARELYGERKKYISRLREMNVFPLAIANQGKTYVRRAQVINIIGLNAYCAIMHLRKVLTN